MVAALLLVAGLNLPHPLDAWREMDADLLAGVALGEDPSAATAVMWTVLNRAKGEPIISVLNPKHFHGMTWRPRKRYQHPLDRAAWIRLKWLAFEVLEGNVPDPTGGATHFHARGTWTPPWAPSEQQWTQLGRTAFYVGG